MPARGMEQAQMQLKSVEAKLISVIAGVSIHLPYHTERATMAPA